MASAAVNEMRSGLKVSECESSFRALFFAHPLPMWVYDISTLKFLEVNEAAMRVYGYSQVEFLAMTIADIRPPVEVARLRQVVNEVTERDQEYCESGPWQHRRRDGQLVCVRVYSRAVTWQGKAARLVVVEDITAQAVAEERLRESEERRRLAMDSAKLGTWDYNPSTGELLWCDRCRELVEIEPSTAISYATFVETIYPDERERIVREAERTLRLEQGSDYQVEYRVVGKRTGRLRWISARGRVMCNAQGRPERFIGCAMDVTDQRESDERLRRLTAELLASNRELEQFASVVSHDLREPLRMITAFLSLLSNNYGGKLDAEADEFIDFAVSGARRLRDLIDGLMQLSNLGRTPLGFQHLETGAIVEDVLRNLDKEIRKRLAEIKIGALPTVWCEPKLLELVFQNLVANALEYAKPEMPSVIEVTARATRGEWEFRVADQGVGIEGCYTRRIFDPFFRIRAEKNESGRGMGLSLAKKAIEKHGGRLWVDSQPGVGSTFLFTLPKDHLKKIG